jgi:hypothetical protein
MFGKKRGDDSRTSRLEEENEGEKRSEARQLKK